MCLYKSAAQHAAVILRSDDRLDSWPRPQVIIDDLAEEGKAPDSKSNRRKSNPNRECGRHEKASGARKRWRSLAAAKPGEKNVQLLRGL
jgi:hypothetical protein